MKKQILFLLVLTANFAFTPLYAQSGRHDKGHFVDYTNDFYSKIKQSIEHNPNIHYGPFKVFKVDLDGIDLPKSVNEFTTVWCNSPVSQGNTGTCWCFATSSFYEAEIFRQTKQQIQLSQMFTVYWEYVEKAREFVRTRGQSAFGEGSETNAPARMAKLHGMVPLEAFPGKANNQEYFNHAPLFSEMNDYLQSVKASHAWNEDVVLSTIRSLLNQYIGTPPESFEWKGKTYTPMQFMTDVAKFNPDDYVDFMSLMEKPYWSQAEYKVPDNWWHSADYYNVPLNDFMNIIKDAVKKGYSIAIGGDVSESGIVPSQDVAIVPSYDIPSEYIDENARQFRFSNHSTTDDHALHLVGYKIDDHGHWWFLIKDSGSSGHNGNNPGWFFYDEDYIKLKMMTFTINKNAVKSILKKFD